MLVDSLFNNPVFPQFVSEMGFNIGEQAWNTARLHILFLFPSDPSVRVVGNTQYALYNIIKNVFGDQVYVDIYMMPNKNQQKIYYKNYPAVVGSFSKRTWEDFDVIGISLAITMMEFAQGYKLLDMAHIPLHSSDRIKNDKYPYVVTGGIAMDTSTGFNTVTDIYSYGLGERMLPKFVTKCFEAQDKFGTVKKAKEWLNQILPNTVSGFYNPHVYHYSWENVKGHIECEYLGHDKGYPDIVLPEVDIPMQYIYTRDRQFSWSTAGNQRRASITSSLGCSGSLGNCNFCKESSLYGGWRERPVAEMIKGLRTAKATSMGETFSYESFNHNFVSDFPGSLQAAYEFFDKLSVINFRGDALAISIKEDGEYNYLRLLKELGTISVSSAVEGFGDRIRNKLLNKNFSFEDWYLVEKEAFRLKFIRVKNGFILTGHETKEDWKDAINEMKQIIDLRDQMNSNSIYFMSVTKLVHNFGAPVYLLPRVTSYINWLETYNDDFYYYPYVPFLDLGIKLRMCAGKGDTFIQQLLQDLPDDLVEEICLKPALVSEVGSVEYYAGVKAAMERLHIDPKAQFLEFNPYKNPYQHVRASYTQKYVMEQGMKYFETPHTMCLKTPATVGKGIINKCYGCGSCPRQDAVCKEEGIKDETVPHIKWMNTRPLRTHYNIMDIKTAKMKNAPSFWYTFIMSYNAKAKYISKEGLIRKFLIKVAEKDPEQAENFRRLGFYVGRNFDYAGMYSNFYGQELVIAGFRDMLNRDKFQACVDYANSKCEAIHCSKWIINQDAKCPSYKTLVEIDFNLSAADLNKVVNIYETEDFRIYSNNTPIPQRVSFPFDYKILYIHGGYKLYMILPPKANPAFTLLAKWNYNRLQNVVTNMVVKAVLLPVGNNVYMNMATDKTVRVSGFIHVDKELKELEEINDDAPEAEGA